MKMSALNIIANLKETLSVEGIPFMEGRTPDTLVNGEVVTIVDYAYITDKKTKETYPVFIVRENEKHFYFGGMVLNQLFSELDKYSKEEIEEVLQEGIKIHTEQKMSANKRTYTKVTII